MPRKYVKKRKFIKRRPIKRKRGAKKYTVKIRPSLGPVAPRTICSMRYSSMWQQASASLDYIFNLNSVWDPDRSGVGHQPYGRDTYATLYNRYRVFAVSGTLTTTIISGTATVAILPMNDVVARTNMSLIRETPGAQFKPVIAGQSTVIRFKYNLPKVNGSTPAAYKADDRFQAINNTDPIEQMGLHVLGSDSLGSPIGASNMYHAINLTYHVEWFDPIELAQS